MRNSRILIILVAGLLAACTKPATRARGRRREAADGAKAAATTVATVNGKQLSSDLLDVFVQAVSGGAQEAPSDEQKAQMLDQLINMTLAAQAAEKDGLAKDTAVQARIDLLRTQILAEAASEKFVKANPVSEEELKAEYDTQVAAMPKEYKARHILVETKETAESIIRELSGGRRLRQARREGVEGFQRQEWRRPRLVLPADDGQALRRCRRRARERQVHDRARAERVRLPRDPARRHAQPRGARVRTGEAAGRDVRAAQEAAGYIDGLREAAKIQK
jgi:hypothetical protein